MKRVNIPTNLTELTWEELEQILWEVSFESRTIVEELSKRYKQKKKEEESLKKAS